MKRFAVLVIRALAASTCFGDARPCHPAIQLLCITLEPDRAGKIMNQAVSLSDQKKDAQKSFGHVWPAILKIVKAHRPSCVFLDFKNSSLSSLANAIEEKLRNESILVRWISAGSCNETKHWGPGPGKNLSPYSRLKAVPGTPLTALIRDSGFHDLLQDALQQMGFGEQAASNRLGRIRVDDTFTRLWLTGQDLAYHFKKPKDIPLDLVNDIVDMVGAGGSVDTTHVRANLEGACLIGYAVENKVIVGNSSLKHPRQAFIDRLKKMTGLDFTGCVERGYTSVRPEYRNLGIGTRLLEGLTSRALDVRIYSVIDEKNIAAQKIAIHNHTRKIARYFSEKAGKDLGVWMPQTMADDFLNRHMGDKDS